MKKRHYNTCNCHCFVISKYTARTTGERQNFGYQNGRPDGKTARDIESCQFTSKTDLSSSITAGEMKREGSN